MLGEPEAFQGREAVEPIGAVVVDHDLRPVGGAGRAEDAGEVGRRVALRQAVGRDRARHRAEEIIVRIGIGDARRVAAEADERLAGQQSVAVQLLVHQGERGVDRGRELGNEGRVELDVERRDDGAEPPGREPDDELFERLVGEQQHAAAFAHAVLLECRRDVGDRPLERAEADRFALVEVDDRGLVGIAPRIAARAGRRSAGTESSARACRTHPPWRRPMCPLWPQASGRACRRQPLRAPPRRCRHSRCSGTNARRAPRPPRPQTDADCARGNR